MKTINFLPRWKNGILGLQHLIAMFGATTLVPLLTGLDISMALFTAGVGTLIFHLCTKGKVPIFLGSSFAFIPALITTISVLGIREAQSGIIMAGILYLLFALFVKKVGVEKIKKLFPTHVIGTMIVLIGASLIPAASKMITSDPYLGVWTFIIAMAIIYFARGFISQMSVLISMSISYALAFFMGRLDFSGIAAAPWFDIPTFTAPIFSWEAILIIAPMVLLTFMEHIGDISANQSVAGGNWIENPGLHRTLIGDGLATAFAGLVGGPPNTTYSENTGLLKITKQYDPQILRIAAVFAIILSFFGKIAAIFASIPVAVLGGISLILFSMIIKTGIASMMIDKVAFSKKQWFIILFMLTLGLSDIISQQTNYGSIGIQLGQNLRIGGVALSGLLGVIINWILSRRDTNDDNSINSELSYFEIYNCTPQKKKEIVTTAVNKIITENLEQGQVETVEISDGSHTFRELYEHRTVLFAALCNSHPESAWKTKNDNEGKNYKGLFLVGITTPKGQFSYHCDNTFWSMFNIPEVDKAPKWDGHTSKDVVRMLSLAK